MVMKSLILTIISLIISSNIFAFEGVRPRVIYSRDSIFKLFVTHTYQDIYDKRTSDLSWDFIYTEVQPNQPKTIFELSKVFGHRFFVSDHGNFVVIIDWNEYLTKQYERASIKIYSKKDNKWLSWKFTDLRKVERLSEIKGFWFNSLSFIEEKYIVLTLNKSKRKTTQLYINLETMKLSKQKL